MKRVILAILTLCLLFGSQLLLGQQQKIKIIADFSRNQTNSVNRISVFSEKKPSDFLWGDLGHGSFVAGYLQDRTLPLAVLPMRRLF